MTSHNCRVGGVTLHPSTKTRELRNEFTIELNNICVKLVSSLLIICMYVPRFACLQILNSIPHVLLIGDSVI